MSFHHLIWILATLALQGSCRIEKDRVITIDKFGIGSVECCAYGHCHCLKLALALELVTSRLCQHNFEHNRSLKALSIMPA